MELTAPVVATPQTAHHLGRFIDLMIPELWLPVPGLIIGLIGLRILARLLDEANQAEASHA